MVSFSCAKAFPTDKAGRATVAAAAPVVFRKWRRLDELMDVSSV